MKTTNSNILFSIKPKYLKLILNGQKIYEYRSIYWKLTYPSWFAVYESSPTCMLKYFILLDHPYKNGEKIPHKSYGTERFNNGEMNRKYAYPILNIIEFENQISLEVLRRYSVTPPQNYIYINRKEKLNTLITPVIDNLSHKF